MKLSESFHMPRMHCPACGYAVDAAMSAGEDDEPDTTPTDGSLAVCMRCASVNIYCNDATSQRLPTPEERADIFSDPTVQKIVSAALMVIESRTRRPGN